MQPDTEHASTVTAHCVDAREKGEGGVIPPCQGQLATEQSLADKATANATFSRLAQLDPVEYDRVRKQEADALGIRAATLDDQVQAARKSVKPAGAGSLLEWQVKPWPEPVDPATLLHDIAAVVGRFIICPRETTYAVALWAAMTWFMEVVQVAPIAMITAPEKRCGKTELLNLLGKLVYRPLQISNVTAAALYRAVDVWKPTMLIDEVDTFMQDNEALRGIMNSGHTRDTAWILRCSGDEHEPTAFNTWGAKAVAGIGGLPGTIMDRSITMRLRRKLPHEGTEKLRHASGVFIPLVRKLARFSADYQDAVAACRPPSLEALHDRAQDNWEPLLCIAQVAGGHWPELARRAAVTLTDTDNPSVGAKLLADIRTIAGERGHDRISTETLLAALCADEEGPWAAFRQGQPMTASQLAKQLSEYGIKSQTIRLGSSTAKGYLFRNFEDAFARYLTDASATAVTPSHASEHAGSQVTEVSKSDLEESSVVTLEALQHKGCDGVTDKADMEGQVTEA